MPPTPIVFKTTHRIRFSDLDAYNHMTTGQYATYYVDHRMQGLRDRIGWDLETIAALPFMELTITSFVRELRGPDAVIECAMVDAAGKNLSRCLMTVAHVDRASNRATDWPPDVAALFFERDAV